MLTAAENKIRISFEVFPARDEVGEGALKRCISELKRFDPRFVSVTYGADGGDRDRTLETMRMLRDEKGVQDLAGHITCVGASRDEVLERVEAYKTNAGAKWCVALRGDSPNGVHADFEQHADGFSGAPELIAALRERSDLKIAVGGYPEPHPASQGGAADLDHLKNKVDAGADAIITQYFFDNEVFFRFRDQCAAAGIAIPIVPGIMPIKKFAAIRRFSRRCGASIPSRLADRFEKAAQCGAEKELALAVCAGQCDELRDEGVDQLHFYTLNDAALSVGTCQALGLDPSAPVDGDGLPVDATVDVRHTA